MKINEMKIVITGGASGMGRDFSLKLAQAGASVAVCDLDDDGLTRLSKESKNLAGALRTYRCDVADEGDVTSFFEQAWHDLNGLNGLVNNAGIFRDALLVKREKLSTKLRQMSLADWQKVIDVDLTGPFLCTREFASRCIENNTANAVIINMSSVSRHGNIGQSNYSAAKAGLVADTVTWSKELARYGIRVAAIAPGFIDTPILKGMRRDALDNMLKAVPLRRVGTSDEIFLGVRFIIECDYFTGRCLDIDGGLRI